MSGQIWCIASLSSQRGQKRPYHPRFPSRKGFVTTHNTFSSVTVRSVKPKHGVLDPMPIDLASYRSLFPPSPDQESDLRIASLCADSPLFYLSRASRVRHSGIAVLTSRDVKREVFARILPTVGVMDLDEVREQITSLLFDNRGNDVRIGRLSLQ